MEKAFYIAGVQFRPGMKEVGKSLEEGMRLDLVPDLENKFDPNAVAINYGETMLGYVPMKFSSEVASLMEVDELECTIIVLDLSAKPWEQCKVIVKTKEE